MAARAIALRECFDCHREQVSNPLPMKIVLRCVGGWKTVMGELMLGFSEIEGGMFGAAATLQPAFCLPLVRHESVQTCPQKRTESGFAGVVAREIVLFDPERKEALHKILGI